MPVIIRILGESSPEVAAVLGVLSKKLKKQNSEGNGKQAQRGGEAQDNEIETAIIQALAPLQNTLHFDRLISKTNDYNQTLAHFAVLFGYITLLRRLVEWKIDLSIADVNGLTVLHWAYEKGDRASVDLLLENGASETALDPLGRAPPHLMPDGFDSSDDYDTGTISDDQSGLEELLDGISLSQRDDLGHEALDPDDEMSVGSPGRGCQEWVGEMSNHNPVASTSKAAPGSPMSQVQHKAGRHIRKRRRTPDIPIDPGPSRVLSELQERLVDPEAIEYSRREAFSTGEMPLSTLRAPNVALLQQPIVSSQNTIHQYWEIDRATLEALKNEYWYINKEVEPATWNGKSILIRWLNETETDGQKYLECRVPLDRADNWCCKPFSGLDRAIAHVRVHLRHEPYLCGGYPNCMQKAWYVRGLLRRH